MMHAESGNGGGQNRGSRRLFLRNRTSIKLGIIIVGLAGVIFMMAGGWIYIKARIAKVLLSSAWQKTLAGEEQVRPWPWADLYPLARLTVPALHVDEIVLSGANGATLAFGPGHVADTGEPGGGGNCVIAGHRDTSFRFLKDLKPGDEIRITDRSGAESVYVVSGSEIVDMKETWVTSQKMEGSLTLVTCYPFDDPLPGRGRYVVFAQRSG
jgi:sortase A